MAIFPTFFLFNIGLENVFYDILQRKNAFLLYKKKKFKKSKNWHFSMDLVHGIGPKMDIFPTFFLGNIDQENVYYDILERKNAFLGYKNKKFKKSKKWDFSKGGSPWFWLSQLECYPYLSLLNVVLCDNGLSVTAKRKMRFKGCTLRRFSTISQFTMETRIPSVRVDNFYIGIPTFLCSPIYCVISVWVSAADAKYVSTHIHSLEFPQ